MVPLQGLSILGTDVSKTQHMYDAEVAFRLRSGTEGVQPFSVGLMLSMNSDDDGELFLSIQAAAVNSYISSALSHPQMRFK